MYSAHATGHLGGFTYQQPGWADSVTAKVDKPMLICDHLLGTH